MVDACHTQVAPYVNPSGLHCSCTNTTVTSRSTQLGQLGIRIFSHLVGEKSGKPTRLQVTGGIINLQKRMIFH